MRHRPVSSPLRVAVLAGSSLTWREEVMRGIASYAHERGPWHIYSAPEGIEDAVFFAEGYRWDGLIVRPSSQRFVKRVLALGVPTVAIGSMNVPNVRLPRVLVDDGEHVRAGLKHLLGAGLRRFAYCSFFTGKSTEDRQPAFLRAVAESGHTCEVFRPRTAKTWQTRQKELARWVRKLPKPIGILAWNPDVSCELVEACHRAGVSVPDEVSVVAADDDRVKCELTSPPITATPIPAARIGFEAASLLHRLMGRPSRVSDQVIHIPPLNIVRVRGSSVRAQGPDREVQKAVEYIQSHLAVAITVGGLADAVGVTRRWLERHFQRLLGQSPAAYLRQQRLTEAQRLLLETDWPVQKVAQAVGFPHPAHFGTVFKSVQGVTPATYRRRHRRIA